MEKPLHNEKYEMLEEEPSETNNDDDDDEVDTQKEGFSILSFGQRSMSAVSTRSISILGNRSSIRTPTIFAPRSPRNYTPLTKSKSADSILIISPASNHNGNTESSPPASPPPSPSRFNQQLSRAFESPKFLSKSDLMRGSSHHTMTTEDSFQFPSPFATHQSMNFGDFSVPPAIKQLDDDDEPIEKSIRRISEGDAFEPISDGNFSFHESMDMEDVFPSVFDDACPTSTSSMPDVQSSSLLHGKSGNGSKGSSFEHAMVIDPFEDDCVEFSTNHRSKEHHVPTAMQTSFSEPVDLVAEMQALQQQHRQEVLELQREIETSKRIISSLTRQVQDLMARNEKLSHQNNYHNNSLINKSEHGGGSSHHQRAVRIDMMGQVIESPDASPSVQQRHKTTAEAKSADPSNDKSHASKKSTKRKSKGTKIKSKKLSRTIAGDDEMASTSTSETLVLDDSTKMSRNKSSSNKTNTTGTTTMKKPKSKRNSTRSITSAGSLDSDEHPLSQAKRRQSLKGKSQRNSIAITATSAVERGSRRSGNKSTNRLSETLEHIWAFDWKDPVKLMVEEKRDSRNHRKHQTKSLAQLKENVEAVGKLPRRKSARKSVAKKSKKAKQATTTIVTEPQENNDDSTMANGSNNVETSPPPKKTKKNNRRSIGAVVRMLSPNTGRRKRTKLVDLSSKSAAATAAYSSVVLLQPEAMPEL